MLKLMSSCDFYFSTNIYKELPLFFLQFFYFFKFFLLNFYPEVETSGPSL